MAAQGHDGDSLTPSQAWKPLGILPARGAGGSLYLLPPSKIQLINKRGSQLNACLKESHGCTGYGCSNLPWSWAAQTGNNTCDTK